MHHSLFGTMSGEFLKVPPGFKVGIDFGQEGALPADILKAGVEGVQCMSVNIAFLETIIMNSMFSCHR